LERKLNQEKVIVLASNSPRRKQILSLAGWEYLILPADVNEDPYPGEDAKAYVLRMAKLKAGAAAEISPPNSLVVGADTSVIYEDSHGKEIILGKPIDEKEAGDMLRKLRGKIHYVYTSLSVIDTNEGMHINDLCSTAVKMRDYSDSEIDVYVSTGDPMDKAGAYAIQHRQFDPVESLEGCYANVVGLPLCAVERALNHWGIHPSTGITRECRPESNKPCLVYRQVLELDPST
jgi:septum formation protein